MTDRKNTFGLSALCVFFVLFMLLSGTAVHAAITSVTLSVLDPPDLLSNGRSYFLAGKTYRFRVQAVDPSATGGAYWNTIVLNITGGRSLTVAIPTSAKSSAVMIDDGRSTVVNNTSVWTNIDFTIGLTFAWNVSDRAFASGTVSATVTNTSPSTMTASKTISYGIASQVKAAAFTTSGDAADLKVNPWHTAFNITGKIVYREPTGDTQTGSADLVSSFADAPSVDEITAISLRLNGAAAPSGYSVISGDESGFDYSIPAEYFADNSPALGDKVFLMRLSTRTDSGSSVDTDTLTLNSNRMRIDNIQFTGGGGVGSMSAPYVRATTVSGTRIIVTASPESATGGTVMAGDTLFDVYYGVSDSPAVWYGPVQVKINSGDITGSQIVSIPVNPPAANLSTTPLVYRVRRISGGAYDDEYIDTTSDLYTHTVLSADRTISWDNVDPPGANTPNFTGSPIVTVPTTYSLRFTWAPLASASEPDFYTYRLYYRKTGDSTYTIVDRLLADYADMANTATSTIVVPGLRAVTEYQYEFSAVDIFGNEVVSGNRIKGTASTVSLSMEATITDGVTTYDDSSFVLNTVASARPVKASAIKVSLYIVTQGESPNEINIIAASSSIGNLITGGAITSGLKLNTDYYRIACSKTAPNTYTTYIPTTNPLIRMGSSVKFIVETKKGNAYSYADSDSETEDSSSVNPNDKPYNFVVSTKTAFAPWPTRILNNVISSSHPRAYPSYYLVADAYVSIRVYDIRGRQVVTLLDHALRKGGQNIKENGWNGRNKSGFKCGKGLYFVYIEATRASDGKKIIDEFEKVIIK